MMVYVGDKNGAFVPEEQAVVSVFDRGFLYGDGLFETVRAAGGKLFRWEDHFSRLQTGARSLGIPLELTSESFLKISSELLRLNSTSDALVRIALSRGQGRRGYSPAGAEEPTLVVSIHPLPSSPEKLRNWRLATSKIVMSDPLAGIKSSSKLGFVMARAEAERLGCDDALLTTGEGLVTETAGSNVFWVKKGVVYTPPACEQLLAGITRKVVIELCEQRGVRVAEKWAPVEQLKTADGIFITQTTLGLIEVVELDGKGIPEAPLTAELHEEYQALVKAAR